MAAKRHHSEHHARSHAKETRRHSDGYYAGHEARRHEEMHDAGMIHEDHNAIANMPQEVMMKPYPKTGPYMPEHLDDTIRGVDHQMDMDDSKRRQHNVPKKV